MTYEEVLADMKASAREQTAKTYRRHGAKDPVLGVSFADMYRLKKAIRRDHPLAQQLWASGISEACILATMVADPASATGAELEAWAKQADNEGTAGALAELVAATENAEALSRRWMVAKNDTLGYMGYCVLCQRIRDRKLLPESEYRKILQRIEAGIHSSTNSTRKGMNSAVIAIGMVSEALHAEALEAARRIGPVHIDHGDTACKTRDAAEYLLNPRLIARKTC